GCTKKREQYDGFIKFDPAAAFFASTALYVTTVNPTKWANVAAGSPVNDWDQAWANMVVKDAIYQGAYHGHDVAGAADGTIESGHQDFNIPTAISSAWFDSFKKYVDI